MPSPMKLTRVAPTRLLDAPMFNRYVKSIQKSTAMSRTLSAQEELHSRVAQHMIERRKFVKRKTPVVLDVGSHSGWFLRHMLEQERASGLATKDWGIKQYIQVDVSEEALDQCYNDVKDKLPPEIELVQICADEEQTPKPFEVPDRSIDMVVSCLSLHWVNQLENAMINIRNVLRRDGFLLLAMFGGNTLYELRSSFSLSDVECKGGLRAHVSPMVDGAGISSLVLQSGFTLPAIDMDRFVLSYKDAFQLCEHLQAMGEQACHMSQSSSLATSNRSTLPAMAAIYNTMYAKNGRIPATFEVFHTVAWSPSPTQPEPLPRGSGEVSLGSIQSNTYKEFTKAMAESAKNPSDKNLQQKADALYQELKDDMDKQQARRAGTDGAEVTATTAQAPTTPEDGKWLMGENQRGARSDEDEDDHDEDVPMAAVGNVAPPKKKKKKGTMVTDLQDRVKGLPYDKPLPPGERPEDKGSEKKKPMNVEEEERWQQFEAFMAASGVNPEDAPSADVKPPK